jgi:hypothetical protein
MGPRLDVDSAVATDDPVRSLRDAVARELALRTGRMSSTWGVMVADRGPRDEILEVLEKRRLAYRRQGREREEDAVTEVMEFLVGWCSPHSRL